jgi:hypothetical protein
MPPNGFRSLIGIAAAAVLCVAVLGGRPASFSHPASLDVPRRSDSTPWVAARGSFVAVTWGASAGGRTDVFEAASRDSGETFGAPVQVNTVQGEARLGGELPPRVALSVMRGSSTPEIAVVWTARGGCHAHQDGEISRWRPHVLRACACERGRVGDRRMSRRRSRTCRRCEGDRTSGLADGDRWPAPEGALFYASTHDGANFTPRVRIPTLGSSKPSHPQIVVDGSGRVFVAWDETIQGRRAAAVREIERQPNRPLVFGEIVRLSPHGAAVHPVLAATDKGLVAVWTSGGNPSHVETSTIPMP